MKKILALALAGVLTVGAAGAASAAASVTESPVPQDEVEAVLYLVPGTYTADGQTVENTVGSGATKLSADECGEIFTDNAYRCTLGTGAALPVPASERKDADGKSFAFNGWWSIVDATVTYFTTVPEISETTFLYADWRAELSQRKDPVDPEEGGAVLLNHYMSVKRKATGETETLPLRVSGTDMQNADTLGYAAPVQLYNDWFELCPGDVVTVYSAGLGGSTEVQVAPLAESGREIQLESSGDGSNVTADFLEASSSLNLKNPLTVTYKESLKARHFRIYVKFYFGGTTMAIYMEPMD